MATREFTRPVSAQKSNRVRPVPRDDLFELLWRPVATLGTLLLQSELDVLYAIQKARRRLPLALRWLADRLISAHPFYDLSLVVWVCTIVGLGFLGWGLMWVMTVNVFVSFVLGAFLGGPVPAELDARLKPRGRASPSGFPCIELHLATVCLVMVGRAFPNTAVLVTGSIIWLLLAGLRMYGVTHFPHQLVLSTVMGLLSIPACDAFERAYFPRGLHQQLHLIGALMVFTIFIGYVAYKAENNDAPILRVPKAEFTRVLGEIMAQDDAAVAQQRRATNEEDGKGQVGAGSGLGSGIAIGAQAGMRMRASGKAGAEGREASVAEAESAWRGSGANSDYPPANSRYPPQGPVAGSDSASRRGELARALLGNLVQSLGGPPPAGASGGGGRPGRPPAGPVGTSASVSDGYNFIPAVPSALVPDAEEEESEEDGDGDGRPQFVKAKLPPSERPSRDSFFYLMRGMEQNAHKEAVRVNKRVLGLDGGAAKGGPENAGGLGGLASPVAGGRGRGTASTKSFPQANLASDAAYWGYGEEEEVQ